MPKPKPRRPKTYGPTETQFQISTVAALRLALPRDAVLHHSHNEGIRSAREAGIAKAMGQRAGFSDLIIFWRRNVYLLELKVGDGRQAQVQKDFQADMAATGFPFYRVCWTLDDVVAALVEWGVPLRIVGNVGPLTREALDKAALGGA